MGAIPKWYYEAVGASKCAIVDTYWQTETGGHIVSPLPGKKTASRYTLRVTVQPKSRTRTIMARTTLRAI